MKSGIRIIRHMLPDPPLCGVMGKVALIPEKRTYLLPEWVKFIELNRTVKQREGKHGVLTNLKALTLPQGPSL